MAKIHYVSSAQQRYEMVPVIDPDTGQPKVITTSRSTRARNGRPSRPITQRVTQRDLSRPLPPETCEGCHEPINPGEAYRWVETKTAYGSRRHVKHARCGSWQPWDLSDALWAQLARVSHAFQSALDSAESAEDVQAALEEAASEIEEIAEAKREAGDNVESGFGQATTQSDELHDIADELEQWAGEISSASVPDFPDPDDADCEACDGTGKDGEGDACDDCSGTGHPSEVTETQLDEWREECRSDLSVVDESPV